MCQLRTPLAEVKAGTPRDGKSGGSGDMVIDMSGEITMRRGRPQACCKLRAKLCDDAVGRVNKMGGG